MFNRALNPLQSNSFFLFGARGTGKSTLVRRLFDGRPLLEIDLLEATQFEQATLALPELEARIEAAAGNQQWIFIDEVQKAPRLLDSVQRLIDKRQARFILTGSSARKLRRGGANLLAGRAYTYNLHPMLKQELGETFELNRHLAFGGLPRVWNISDPTERVIYLRSYLTSYLKEEIAEEQAVRKLEPFGKFLQVAAQSSGTIINYSNIARDVGVSDQTVKTYFQILGDTLLGTSLAPYAPSIRKAQGKSPKFYLFDTGVLRALRRTIDQPLSQANYEYGHLFEHFIIGEIQRRAEYGGKDYRYSFLRTVNDDEIDLIIDRPGKCIIAIEIKSTDRVKEEHCKVLQRLGRDIKGASLMLLSQDREPKLYGDVHCLPWDMGIAKILE